MPSLIECASCHRHVRASDTACPFCEEALVAVPHRAPLVTARRVAAIAMSAAALTACGDDDLGNAQPVYGAPDPTTTSTGGGMGGEGGTGGSSAGGSAAGGSAQGGAGGTGEGGAGG